MKLLYQSRPHFAIPNFSDLDAIVGCQERAFQCQPPSQRCFELMVHFLKGFDILAEFTRADELKKLYQ